MGHSCPGGICPESGPLSLTCSITTMLGDDWHLAYKFSLAYFTVEVCLVGVFPHSVSTWWYPCVRVYVPLTLPPSLTRKQNRRGDPALYLSRERGHLNWRMGLPALLGGNLGCWVFLISPHIAQFMVYVMGRIHYGLKVVFCFRHLTVSHYHHDARLLTGVEHMPVMFILLRFV